MCGAVILVEAKLELGCVRHEAGMPWRRTHASNRSIAPNRSIAAQVVSSAENRAWAPAVALTMATGIRVIVYDGVEGVGPRPRCKGRPAEGSVLLKPFSDGNGFVTNDKVALFKPSAVAVSVIVPGVVVDLISILFTPPSTGKLLARI